MCILQAPSPSPSRVMCHVLHCVCWLWWHVRCRFAQPILKGEGEGATRNTRQHTHTRSNMRETHKHTSRDARQRHHTTRTSSHDTTRHHTTHRTSSHDTTRHDTTRRPDATRRDATRSALPCHAMPCLDESHSSVRVGVMCFRTWLHVQRH